MSVTPIGTGDAGVPIETPQHAFERLIHPHLRRLYRLAFRLTGSAADAEDLLQDVLTKLFERADELSSIADLRPWTARVLYNRYIDQRRRARTRRLRSVELRSAKPQEEVDPDSLPANRPGPEDDASVAFDIRRLERALEELSEEHRIVVLLHDAEGCALEEIGAMTGVPVGTVKSRLHRARERLRQLWGDGTLSG
ncbi:MAG: RNA polymerase sigma factor [Steroidobacteraceae bacterium]